MKAMRRSRVVAVVAAALVALLTFAAAPAGAQTEPPAPDDVGPGTIEHFVGRRTIEVTSEPGRTLTADVWYPANEESLVAIPRSTYEFPGLSYTSTVAYDSPPVAPNGPFPLIVYSHGSGGLRYVSAFLTEALAARGFVVIAVDHTGNTAIDEFAGTELPREEIVRLRPVDIRAEIDAMAAANDDPASPFVGAVDASRVGLVGHSAGATGVLQTVADGGTGEDADVRAVVGMGPYVDPVTDEQLASIELPTMLVSGTRDTTTPIRTQTERAWKRIPGDPLYRVDLKDAGHQSFTDVCFYQDLAAAKPETAEPIVEAIDSFAEEGCTPKHLPIEQAHRLIDRYIIGFFDRYVAGEKSAQRFLEPTQPKVVDLQVVR
jgi:predicted dienelactone hydrolase